MTDALPNHIVSFHGDELVAVQQPDGTIFVVFARLCDNLGLNQQSQARRISRHAVLSTGLVSLAIQTAGGAQTMQCLRVSLLPLWLSGVHAGRARPEVQERLQLYQQEAADVLWQAFKQRILIEGDGPRMPADSPGMVQLQQIAEMGRAIALMAEQQMALQRQQQTLTLRLDTAAKVIRDVQIRLGVLEDTLSPAAIITEAQATQLMTTVKALAEWLTSKNPGKNYYQGIYMELYRRFEVPNYKRIRQEQFAAVMQFLEDWRAAGHA